MPKLPKTTTLLSLCSILRKNLVMNLMHADKHPSFLEVDFNTLGIKVSYKLMLSSIVMIKHSQSNKFAISLQKQKKEIRDGVRFL